MSLRGKTILVGFLSAIGALAVGVAPVRAAATTQSDSVPRAPKRILVLYDENKDQLPGLARTDRSLRESFEAALGNGVEVHSDRWASRGPRGPATTRW